MKRLTVQNILNLRPCKRYSRKVVNYLWGGSEDLSLLEIAELGVPVLDRIWVLYRARYLGLEGFEDLTREFQVRFVWTEPKFHQYRLRRIVEIIKERG